MGVPSSLNDLFTLVGQSGIVEPSTLSRYRHEHPELPEDVNTAAEQLVRDGLLTPFQARLLLSGRTQGLRLGQYRLLERIGSGGAGQVFLGEHTTMKRRVAVKVLPPSAAEDPVNLERFLRESRAVAALDHPNIVHAYDIGCESGLHYLVMEFVQGQTLEDILKKDGPLPPGKAAEYVRQAALGLQHAFESGLIHRDIKPSNLLLEKSGIVKVLDLGLARFAGGEDGLTQNLDKGAVLGTMDFMSPEQGMDSSAVDIRADIYSLGCTLYKLLTGEPPYKGSTSQKLIAHQVGPIKFAHHVRPEVPEGLSAIAARMMAKNPADRYQTPLEVAIALEEFSQPGSSSIITRSASALSGAYPRPSVGDSAVSMALPSAGGSSGNYEQPDLTSSSGNMTRPDLIQRSGSMARVESISRSGIMPRPAVMDASSVVPLATLPPRPVSAEQVWSDVLENTPQDLTAPTPRESPVVPKATPARKSMSILWIISGVGLVLGSAAIIVLTLWPKPIPTKTAPKIVVDQPKNTGYTGPNLFQVPTQWHSILENPYLEAKKPRWEVGGVWPADIENPKNYKPFPTQESGNQHRWYDPTYHMGINPSAKIEPDGKIIITTVGMREGWKEKVNGPRVSYLAFYAPTDGSYTLKTKVRAKRWEGDGELVLQGVRIDQDKSRITFIRDAVLANDQESEQQFDFPNISTMQLLVLRFLVLEKLHTQANCQLWDLTIERH